jgi:hypothetical protein
MEFLIKPNDGIGAIKLGMTRKQVKELLAEHFSSSDNTIDFYFDNSLQIEFEKEFVDFIGISQNDAYKVSYENIDAFDVDGARLFSAISANESKSHMLNESEYIFPEQIITLWEMDEQYDYLGSHKRKVWAQVGIGTKSYLKVVNGL